MLLMFFYLEKNNQKIATDTLYRYVEAICSTFIMNRVYRYDIYGKSVLKTLNKFYATDLGVKKIKTNSNEVNYSHALENVVYNELVNKGYDVYIGKMKTSEIDFIASNDKGLKYIQVCYLLKDENTLKREIEVLEEIDDSYPKYIILIDKEDYGRGGIKHLNIFDFLMNDDF